MKFVGLEFGPNLPAGVTAGYRSYAEVSIEDNDIPEALTITFAVSRDHLQEGRTVSVDVRLSESPDREVVIPINATNQGGASSADYVGPMSVTFDPDDKYKSITFEAAEDTIDDDGESVLLSFGVPLPEGVSLGSEEFRTTTIFIIDGGLISLGLAQVGVGVTAHIHDETHHTFEDEGRRRCHSERKRHQRSVAVAALGCRARRVQRHPCGRGRHVESVHPVGGRPGHVAQGKGNVRPHLQHCPLPWQRHHGHGPDRGGDHAAAGVSKSGGIQRGLL